MSSFPFVSYLFSRREQDTYYWVVPCFRSPRSVINAERSRRSSKLACFSLCDTLFVVRPFYEGVGVKTRLHENQIDLLFFLQYCVVSLALSVEPIGKRSIFSVCLPLISWVKFGELVAKTKSPLSSSLLTQFIDTSWT